MNITIAVSNWLENAIFDFCSDQFNLDLITAPGGSGREGLFSERAVLVTKIAELEIALAGLSDEAIAGGLPKVLLKRMHDMEAELDAAKHREQQIAAELSVSTSTASATSDVWSAIRESAINLDYDARVKARKLVRETFEKIVVYYSGGVITTPEGHVDILLVAKNGVSRLLTISRKSGQVVSGLERITRQ